MVGSVVVAAAVVAVAAAGMTMDITTVPLYPATRPGLAGEERCRFE
jgi:hypothetical protein